jgi:hypothetical protein
MTRPNVNGLWPQSSQTLSEINEEMSNFIRRTKNPRTGKFEDAYWIDDCYGPRKYGVQFPSQTGTYDARQYDWEFEDAQPTDHK